MVANKDRLEEKEADIVKEIFKDILKKGERYDVEDIESWFENEGSWNNKSIRVRVTNLAHYVQSKYEQTATLRIVNDDHDSCSDESCSCGN